MAPRSLWLRASSALLLAVFSCSVYDLPDVTSGGGEAGKSATTAGMPSSAGGRDNTAGDHASPASGSPSVSGSASGGAENSGTGGGAGNLPFPDLGGAGGATDTEPAGGQGGEPPSPPDLCPSDPLKTAPGTCGCGIPEVSTASVADCATIKKKLIHRYDFEGTGTQVLDRVGTAHGALRGASLSKLDGKGVVLLGGGSNGSYVDLPNGLASSLNDATFEAWVTWGGGGAWQRIFDFGDTSNATPENNPAYGKTYLCLTPQSAAGVVRFAFSLNANGAEQGADATAALPQSLTQVVAVADDTANLLKLYIDGKKAGSVAWTGTLSAINDVNVWLGRSQYDADPELSGVYHEFRVYGAALTDAEVVTTFRSGTDPAYLRY